MTPLPGRLFTGRVEGMSQAGTMERPSYSVPPEQVVQELSEPLRRYLQRYSGSHALADDLLQETLIRVVHGLPSFEGRASVKTWAFSIATRVAADLTAVQIAEVCGCSAATAKIRIHRARLRLKETLQQECDFYRDSENVLRCDRKCDE